MDKNIINLFYLAEQHFRSYFIYFCNHPKVLIWKDLFIFVGFHLLVFHFSIRFLTGGYNFSFHETLISLKKSFFRNLRKIPSVEAKIQKELEKVINKIEHDLSSKGPQVSFTELPLKGMKDDAVIAELKKMASLNTVEWDKGKVSGTVYHGGQELTKILCKAYEMFSYSNLLHPEVFPATRIMEANIISMTSRLFNAPGAYGSITSGGTESILMACKAYRDRALDLFNITNPEMLVPITAHAAFDKAASYFKIKIKHAPMGKDWKVDLRALESMITSNTIMVVGSAPNYPHGIIDDIEKLGSIALKYNVGLHVDCCLGSFIMPFLKESGFNVPLFDFRVKGVTSISCDTHKFGFATKGSSVILYSSPEIRKYQYFVAELWPGGIYASPSVAGSRSVLIFV